ncbi:MAG: HAMP domain-containing histidine kinase [Halobacteriovoraceae bacterium]|nr:HAMP domain-containing histidine kinase [Halobacteriovoraceae bacterium]
MDNKNRQEIISFKKYIERKMVPYQIALPIVIAALSAIITASIIFIQYADSDKSFIESIAPHISTLLETQDGPEIQRFLKAVSIKHGSAIEVISKNNEIIGSSLDSSRIGTELKEQLKDINILDLKLNNGKLISMTNVSRINGPDANGAKLIAYLNLNSILYVAIGISLAVFVFSFLALNWLISKVISISKESLLPLNNLENFIREMKSHIEESRFEYSNIKEIENIRFAFIETFEGLNSANEELAKSKAKELATTAYKNLIHDLHVPVTALRNHIKIFNHERATSEDKEKALTRIVELAEQVLKQVKAARSNLALDVTLKENDIVDSVVKAANDAQVSLFDRPNIQVKTNIAQKNILIPHDPVMLGRAVSNLVSNAIESANNEVIIDVTSFEKIVSIKVSDDGRGLKQEDASLHLQGRGKSTKADRMGIGLSSANHIIRSHGGKIIYQQSLMGGACFEIQLQGASV